MINLFLNRLGFISLSSIPRKWRVGDDLYYVINIDASLTITNKKVCFLCGSTDVVSEYKNKSICTSCNKGINKSSILSQGVTVICNKLYRFNIIYLPKEFKTQINMDIPTFEIIPQDNHSILLIPKKNACHVCGNTLNDVEDALLHGHPLCDDCINHLSTDLPDNWKKI